MKNVCLKCGCVKNEFGSQLSLFYDGKECNHDFVEIDDLLVEAMIILNRKGYKTMSCCQGHIYEGCNTGYVSFELPIFIKYKNPEFTHVEPTYSSEIEATPTVLLPSTIDELHNNIKNINKSMIIYNNICKFCSSVLKWAYELPEFDKEEFINSKEYKDYIKIMEDDDYE